VVHPKRKTIGVRIPGHAVAHALLAELDAPMLSTTLILKAEEQPLTDAQEIRVRLERQLELIIDAGSCGVEPSTVIDLTADAPLVVRAGKGSLAPFAVESV
jgi:tRNA threonylcarbamoyl adenosine modification protein (Sua5/YciO/YrdC/YwlC family)